MVFFYYLQILKTKNCTYKKDTDIKISFISCSYSSLSAINLRDRERERENTNPYYLLYKIEGYLKYLQWLTVYVIYSLNILKYVY